MKAETDDDVTEASSDLLSAVEEVNETFSKRQDVVLGIPAE